jgi:alcohol dehydrogenase class IV
MPKDITIQTALDTLSHALESIWNKNANEITISYAIKAAKLVVENILPLSYDLENIIYRNNIMKASMYAGFAFSQTQTAIAHAMSYYITAYKKVDHGIACSFTLPLLVDSIIGKYAFIDYALTEIFEELSSYKLRSLLNDLKISTEFSDYGITDQDVLNNLDENRLKNSLIRKIDIE